MFLFFFFSFCYGDTSSILRYQIGFADSILHGDFAHLYRRAYDAILIAQQNDLDGTALPTYDAPFNFLFGLWGILLYYIQRAISVDFRICFRAVAYGKSLFLVALCIAVLLIYRICLELGKDRKQAESASFLFLTSSLTTTCVGVIGQSDIVTIVFILLGFLNYVRQKDGWFLFWFVVAYPFKQYALFVFLPLLLLRDKNFFRVSAKMALMAGIAWVLNTPLRNDADVYANKQWFSTAIFGKLLENNLPLVDGGVPVAVVILGILCVWCYLRKPCDDAHAEDGVALFVALAAMSAVFASFPSFPYWYMHLVPWLAIVCVYFSSQTKKLMLFETAGTAAITFSNYILYYWCYDISNMKDMLLYRLMGNPDIDGIFPMMDMAGQDGMENYQAVAASVFVVCMLTICWLCRPNQKGDFCERDSSDMAIAKLLIVRFIVNTAICAVPIFMFFNVVKG